MAVILYNKVSFTSKTAAKVVYFIYLCKFFFLYLHMSKIFSIFAPDFEKKVVKFL